MAANFAAYSGLSNVGFKQKVNEDYIVMNDRDFGNEYLFACVADGSGGKDSMFRPAAIVSNEVEGMMARFYKKDPDLFRSHTKLLLEEAFLSANNTLIGFKLGDEEGRYGFASTLSAAIISKDGKITIAHAGNTRIYILRDMKIIQVTRDHTQGWKLVENNAISEDQYYTTIERLSLYNGIGISPEPKIQTAEYRLKKNDVVILCSDGIHYSYKKEAFFDILLRTQTMDDAAQEMIKTALDLKSYSDNISVEVIWYLGEDANLSQSGDDTDDDYDGAYDDEYDEEEYDDEEYE